MTKSTGKQKINRYMSVEERFWLQTNRLGNNDCWEWTGAFYATGYGEITVNGKNEHAQRVSWLINVGEIPDGLHVLHECDNRACVNPSHLFLGTNLENIEDKVKKGRQRKGSDVPTSKLNDDLVRKIRQYKADGYSLNQLSSMFGIAIGQLSMIVNRKAWKHVS